MSLKREATLLSSWSYPMVGGCQHKVWVWRNTRKVRRFMFRSTEAPLSEYSHTDWSGIVSRGRLSNKALNLTVTSLACARVAPAA